jgi:very-short-patch-repair endonuclease
MENKVICKICGHEAGKSIQAHINRFHGISRDVYVGRYPGASILSDSFLKEISDKNRELATRPGWSTKVSRGVKKLWQDPVYKKEHSEALKKGQNSIAAKENHRKGACNYFLGLAEQEKENKRQSIVDSWKDPEKRKNRVEALRKAHESEEGRKNHSDAMVKYLSIPGNQEKRNKALKETWAKPENRKKLEEIIQIGLKAAASPEGQAHLRESSRKPELRKLRSENAKKNIGKLLRNRVKYSKLNEFLRLKMKEEGLEPEKEYFIGYYYADFCFVENKVVVEVDGDWWHANPEFMKERNLVELHPIQKKMIQLDKVKNSYLKNHGWKVLRFWERDIYKNTATCIKIIKDSLQTVSGLE